MSKELKFSLVRSFLFQNRRFSDIIVAFISVMQNYGTVEKRDFSTSALAQHEWEHNHHIDGTSMCVLETESHYCSKLPSSFNRDRGTLPDVYDAIIL